LSTQPALVRDFSVFLLLLVFSFLVGGCSRISLEEQFVSATDNLMSKSRGSCNEISPGFSNHDLSRAVKGINPEKITILNWNIYKGQLQGWQSDLLFLSRASDIILLQEASNSEQMRGFLRLQKLNWNHNSAFRYKGVATGVLVASVIEPLYSCGLRQDEPIIGVPKTALINIYPVKGISEKLLVANVHGINITLGTEAYKKQFSELQNVLRQHQGPMVVAGDFNNWSEKRKTIVDALVENLDLTLFPFENEKRTLVLGDPVDHVLFRGLDPIAHELHEVISSDHNPISVTFRLSRKNTQTNSDFQ
jgi:endonuclease/exonuclease/phosphatase (EEP) superfamily protein YafD